MDRDDGAGPGVRSVLRTYHPPPDGFDPHTAADELLRRHGLPRRPDPGREPSPARAWRRAFARPVTFTGAELAPDPVLSSRVPFGGQGTEFDLNPWAGVVRRKGDEPNYPAPATMVFAQFTVSEVATIDPEGYDPLEVAFWVGLDGYNGLNGQILQAGIAARGEPGLFSNSVSYRAWTEWHPAPAGWMTNFPVTAGDTLSFVACAAEPDFGLVSVLNYATGRATTVGVPAPDEGVVSGGGSAEWIVERVSADLPYFFPATFSDCTAGSLHEVFALAPGGLPLDIEGAPSGGAEVGPHLTAPPSPRPPWRWWSGRASLNGSGDSC